MVGSLAGENSDVAPLGLRERRRQETARQISEAAIDLFEAKGVGATTVDEIARAAGISARTFFRYCPTKESALLVDDHASQVITVAVKNQILDGTPVVLAIERAWLALMDDFDRAPEWRAHMLRVRSLIHEEPSLLALALAKDSENVDALIEAVVSSTGRDDDMLALRGLIVAVVSVGRVAFDEWALKSLDGGETSVRAIFLGLRRGLVSYAQQTEI